MILLPGSRLSFQVAPVRVTHGGRPHRAGFRCAHAPRSTERMDTDQPHRISLADSPDSNSRNRERLRLADQAFAVS